MSIKVRYDATIIHNLKSMKTFRCQHCESRFSTTNWKRTPRGYSASCPCCPYTAWMPR